MPCNWGCGGRLTSREMRAHFTRRPNRPAAPDHVDSRGEEPKSQTWTSTTVTRMALPRRGLVILPQPQQYVHGPAIPQVLRIGAEGGISFTRHPAQRPAA